MSPSFLSRVFQLNKTIRHTNTHTQAQGKKEIENSEQRKNDQ